VSPRPLARRTRLSCPVRREGEDVAEAMQRICVVGKPSTMSSNCTSGSISFLAKWSSSLGDFHFLGSLPNSPQQNGDSGRSVCAAQIRSALLGSLRSRHGTPITQSSNNLFSCNAFPVGIRSTALTKDYSGRKISTHRGGSKHTALSNGPNGPVAGLSPENAEC